MIVCTRKNSASVPCILIIKVILFKHIKKERCFHMLSNIKHFLSDERGQASTEYGVIIGAIAVGIIAATIALKGEIVALFGRAGTALAGFTSGS